MADDSGKLLGAVPRGKVERETSDEQTELHLQSQGIVDGEELSSMSLLNRCRKRLSSLAPNIVLNLAAASIIAVNEATLREVIALGGLAPLFLKSRKIDPALASGPILTTYPDLCGFFLALSFASTMLPRLA